MFEKIKKSEGLVRNKATARKNWEKNISIEVTSRGQSQS